MGGLSILAALRDALPGEDFIYFADSGAAPYGGRSADEIRQLTLRAAHWLVRQGAKAIVVACNTACAVALDDVRAEFGPDLPVVGLVPAVKPAVSLTRTGKVGVFATPVTLQGRLLRNVIEQHAQPAGVEVLPAAHLGLVPLVEAGELAGSRVEGVLREALTPLHDAGVDVLVLGCTHYPFVRDAIHAVFPGCFTLLDSGEAIARQTRRVLVQRGLRAARARGGVRLHCTGTPEAAARLEALYRVCGASTGSPPGVPAPRS